MAGADTRTTDQSLIQDGYTICEAVQNGYTPTEVAGILYANSNKVDESTGITLDEAHAIVGAAVKELC